jgi:hypothetical protein
MNKSRILENFTNVAILAVAFVFLSIAYKNHQQSHQTQPHQGPPEIQVGDRVQLEDVDWLRNDSTIILVLNTKCHFCSESGPFYRELSRRVTAEKKKIHLIAVFPQPQLDAREYLRELGVEVEDVRQQTITSIKVSGTPTIILANQRGEVVQTWRGRLSPDEEPKVISALGL